MQGIGYLPGALEFTEFSALTIAEMQRVRIVVAGSKGSANGRIHATGQADHSAAVVRIFQIGHPYGYGTACRKRERAGSRLLPSSGLARLLLLSLLGGLQVDVHVVLVDLSRAGV